MSFTLYSATNSVRKAKCKITANNCRNLWKVQGKRREITPYDKLAEFRELNALKLYEAKVDYWSKEGSDAEKSDSVSGSDSVMDFGPPIAKSKVVIEKISEGNDISVEDIFMEDAEVAKGMQKCWLH